MLVDADDLPEAVAGVLGDGAVRERLEAAGRARAERYSWGETARRIDAMLAAEALRL